MCGIFLFSWLGGRDDHLRGGESRVLAIRVCFQQTRGQALRLLGAYTTTLTLCCWRCCPDHSCLETSWNRPWRVSFPEYQL